jgi:hypothetical protein
LVLGVQGPALRVLKPAVYLGGTHKH